jgi:hypothetical protein
MAAEARTVVRVGEEVKEVKKVKAGSNGSMFLCSLFFPRLSDPAFGRGKWGRCSAVINMLLLREQLRKNIPWPFGQYINNQ